MVLVLVPIDCVNDDVRGCLRLLDLHVLVVAIDERGEGGTARNEVAGCSNNNANKGNKNSQKCVRSDAIELVERQDSGRLIMQVLYNRDLVIKHRLR